MEWMVGRWVADDGVDGDGGGRNRGEEESGHQKIGPATNERRLFENESCWVPESELKTCEWIKRKWWGLGHGNSIQGQF